MQMPAYDKRGAKNGGGKSGKNNMFEDDGAHVAIIGLLPSSRVLSEGLANFDAGATRENQESKALLAGSKKDDMDMYLKTVRGIAKPGWRMDMQPVQTLDETRKEVMIRDFVQWGDAGLEFWEKKHCQQVYYNHHGLFAEVTQVPRSMTMVDMLIDPAKVHETQLPYYPRVINTFRSTYKWGQRKLFMSELAFLVRENVAAQNNAWVIYAGALPGHHIPQLFDEFGYGHVNVVLIDPRGGDFKMDGNTPVPTKATSDKDKGVYVRSDRWWSPKVVRWANNNDSLHGDGYQGVGKKGRRVVHLIGQGINSENTAQIMTDIKLRAEQKSDPKFYFISDIRVKEGNTEGASIEEISADNDLQVAILRQMQPEAALLKTRVAWEGEGGLTTPILKGEYWLQAWSGPSSTEFRLYTNRAMNPGYTETIECGNSEWERYFSHFNHVRRCATYEPVIKFPVWHDGVKVTRMQSGYCTCFDCTLDQMILGASLNQQIRARRPMPRIKNPQQRFNTVLYELAVAAKNACLREVWVSPKKTELQSHNSPSEPDEDRLPPELEHLNLQHMHHVS